MQELACNADAALHRASSVASDLSVRVTQAESQQALTNLIAEQAQAASAAALKETADVRRYQQIAYARMKAYLQVATIRSQSTAEQAAAQAAQALVDARSANIKVPRLDSTMLSLQQEMQALKVAAQ